MFVYRAPDVMGWRYPPRIELRFEHDVSPFAIPQEEQTVQLEAYGRATVAITRARSLCLIMGPLDMKGLLGAATVMGTLMYGAGHVWEGLFLPTSSLPISYHASIFIGSSPGFLVNREVPTLLNFFNLSHLLTR